MREQGGLPSSFSSRPLSEPHPTGRREKSRGGLWRLYSPFLHYFVPGLVHSLEGRQNSTATQCGFLQAIFTWACISYGPQSTDFKLRINSFMPLTISLKKLQLSRFLKNKQTVRTMVLPRGNRFLCVLCVC